MPSQTIKQYFLDYSQYHQTKGNEVSHIIGIPLIAFSLIGLLKYFISGPEWPLPGYYFGLAEVLWLAANTFYLSLNRKLGFIMAFISVSFLFLAPLLSLKAHLALQAIGWISQFIGHAHYEKKSPAFTKNLLHLLIGPLYILNLATKTVKLNR